jgi:hypothetical protein
MGESFTYYLRQYLIVAPAWLPEFSFAALNSFVP